MGIDIRGLGKSYGPFTLFDGLDLHLGESRVTALVGPSGCGKTTLLDMICGATPSDAGAITGLEGRQLGYVFQEPRLLPWLSLRSNIEFVLRDLFPPAECRSRAERWTRLVGLEDFAEFFPHQLSGGMRQRVGLARAFAYPSTLLLLDEPFQALDLHLKMELVRVFEELWLLDRRTTLLVTHDINETLLLADDLFVLSSPPTGIRAHFEISVEHGSRSLDHPALTEIEHRLYAILS